MARRKRRGISIGTYVLLLISVVSVACGLYIYRNISGDFEDIALNPKMVTESFELLTTNIISTEPKASTEAELPFEQQREERMPAATIPPAATEPPSRTLTLRAAGQIAIGDELRRAAKTGDALDFSYMFTPVSHALSGADLSIVTLRTNVTENASEYGKYQAPKELVTALKGAGVSLFNLATDHLLDHGMLGVSNTRSIVQGAQASSAGAYVTQEERQSLSVREMNGIPTGLLAYTTSMSSAGKKAASEAEIQTATRMFTLEGAKADIMQLRQKGAAVVVVLMHWGDTSDKKPSQETRDTANALIEAGADIIIGTNPMQIHEMERRTIQEADGRSRDTLIAYSLGNFLTDDSRESATITGVVLNLSLEWNTNTRSLQIQDVWYMPTWVMRWKEDDTGAFRYQIIPAGYPSLPENMLQTAHNNMNKSYQDIIKLWGSTDARPRME